MKTTLIIVLNLANGKTKDLSISAPRADLTAVDVEKAVSKIVSTKFFLIDNAEVTGCKKAFFRTVEEKAILA